MKLPSHLFTAFVLAAFFKVNVNISQTVGITSGLSYGRLYNFGRNTNSAHTERNYHYQTGSYLGIEIKDFPVDSIVNIGFVLTYENYGGKFEHRDGGLGYSYSHEGSILKHVIGIELYPFQFKLKKHIRFNVGLSYNRTINHKLTEEKNWVFWVTPINYGSKNLNEIDGFVSKDCFGFILSFGYEFKVGNFLMEPRYSYYLGASSDFHEISAKSMRHRIGFSIGYDVKK